MTRRIPLILPLCLLTAFACHQPPAILAQPPVIPPQSETTTDKINTPAATVEVLLNQLNSPVFSIRQAASAELMKLDESHSESLRNARRTSTGEVALRLSRILDALSARWFQQHLTSLGDKPTTDTAAAFFDWMRFHPLVRNNDDALQLFPQLLHSEPVLFTARQYQPETLPALLETRATAFAALCNGRDDQSFPATSAMALMLIASDPDVRLLRATSTAISSCLDDPRFHELVDHGVHASLVRNLLATWFERPGISPDRPLMFATQHRLDAGRSLAVRVLQSQPRGARGFHALMCLAALNSQQDLPLIESLLDAPSPIWPPKGAPTTPGPDNRQLASTWQVQLGDAALLAALHLRNAVSEFPELKPVCSDVTLYRLDSIGFESNDLRKQAHTAYKTRFPPAPTPTPGDANQPPP